MSVRPASAVFFLLIESGMIAISSSIKLVTLTFQLTLK